MLTLLVDGFSLFVTQEMIVNYTNQRIDTMVLVDSLSPEQLASSNQLDNYQLFMQHQLEMKAFLGNLEQISNLPNS